jgi:hypothetical protein
VLDFFDKQQPCPTYQAGSTMSGNHLACNNQAM